MNNKHEAEILLNSLNTLASVLPGLTGGQKELAMQQIGEILSYFEQHQKEFPLGRSVTLGYYFQEDLSLK
jgi:hypothetical protein